MRLRMPWVLFVTAASALSSGCGTPRIVIEAENSRTNTHTVLAFEETVFNKHRVQEGFNRYVGADFKQHSSTGVEGVDAAVDALTGVTKALPDSRVIVQRIVSERDLVAVHAFWDQKPGVAPGVARVDIYRLVNSKIVEHWQVVQALAENSDKAADVF
jgi:predicted SnoaL-like aldol condensation-catalyzing enzyme